MTRKAWHCDGDELIYPNQKQSGWEISSRAAKGALLAFAAASFCVLASGVQDVARVLAMAATTLPCRGRRTSTGKPGFGTNQQVDADAIRNASFGHWLSTTSVPSCCPVQGACRRRVPRASPSMTMSPSATPTFRTTTDGRVPSGALRGGARSLVSPNVVLRKLRAGAATRRYGWIASVFSRLRRCGQEGHGEWFSPRPAVQSGREAEA